MTSAPSSPPTASKKRAPPNSLFVGGRRVSGALSFDTAVSAASALGIPAPKEPKIPKSEPRKATAVRNNGMLPTPNKTPKKAPTETAPAIQAIARNLFPVRSDDQVMPSPKKNKARRTYGLDSFEVAVDEPIQIFTDSMDRVPEVDRSTDNPFFGDKAHAQPEPAKRAGKRRKITVPGEGERTVEELEQRDDGLVYVFRGKRIFRKFADFDDSASPAEDAEDEADEAIEQVVPPNLRRPLTRSSIKPRLLFPTPEQAKARVPKTHTTDDEEAETDIEEPSTSTPMAIDDMAATPKAPRFGPVSPPTTLRATRSKKMDICNPYVEPASEDDEVDAPASPLLRSQRTGGKVSPFDQWQRVKKPAGSASSKKREGEPISRRGGDKKLRAT